MLAEEMLVAALLADSGVVAIVGDRVAPAGGLVSGEPAAISYQRISTVGSNHLTGGGSLDTVRVQLSCWATDALGSLTLAETARDVIAPADAPGIATFQGQQGPTKDLETGQWGTVSDYFIMQERS